MKTKRARVVDVASRVEARSPDYVWANTSDVDNVTGKEREVGVVVGRHWLGKPLLGREQATDTLTEARLESMLKTLAEAEPCVVESGECAASC